PEVLRAVERLSYRAHAPAFERELVDVDDGLVAEIPGAQARRLVQVEPVSTRADDGGSPAPLGASLEKPSERIGKRRRVSDRVARRQPGAVDAPVGERGAPVVREDVALVVTKREGIERVTVAAVDEPTDALALDRGGDRPLGDGCEHRDGDH